MRGYDVRVTRKTPELRRCQPTSATSEREGPARRGPEFSTRRLFLTPPVEADREYDDGAGDDLLHPVRKPLLRAPDLDDGHDRRARDRANDAALPAEQAAAADDHRGNYVELEAVGDGRISNREL